MAQIIGVAGRDAVRKSAEKINEAAHELQRLSSRPSEEELARLEQAIKEPVPWLMGARGECRTAVALEDLPYDFVVFNDFHMREANGHRADWNIDHVVIGPTGIFTIDSKNWRTDSVPASQASLDTKDLLKQARGQSVSIRHLLSDCPEVSVARRWVQAVVVFTDPKTTVRQTRDSNVWVLPLRMLLGHVQDGKRVLTANQIAHARKALEQKRGRLSVR